MGALATSPAAFLHLENKVADLEKRDMCAYLKTA
jgi:hypothetical protein